MLAPDPPHFPFTHRERNYLDALEWQAERLEAIAARREAAGLLADSERQVASACRWAIAYIEGPRT